MRKKRIYLDTSTVSYLQQEDAPIETAQTLEFWEVLKSGKYDVYISDVVLDELSKCPEPKRTNLLDYLSEIDYTDTTIENNAEIEELEAEIRKLNVLPQNSDNDRLHIAAAMYRECNIIVSWNFKHMVNVKTIDGVRVVCVANNLSPIDIYPPSILLERNVTDE